jgi:predicted phage terminase large subunit-like protein
LTPELKRLSSELTLLREERQKRLRARNHLLTYASSIEIPTAPHSIDDDDERQKFVPNIKAFGAHHLYWLDCLQKVEDGQIKRLLGLFPPGSGKSIYTSVVFPTHFLGRNPKNSIIIASYGSDLPKKFGRRARSIVTQPIYRRIFDTGLSDESAAVDEWALTNGSEWLAKGILTGITGNRVDGIIWDDLIKGREQADSKVVRDKTWDAYMDDLQTRRKPTTWEIGINTRWNEDDPPGRILPDDYDGRSGIVHGKDGNEWFVVCLPAICERNDDPLGRQPGDILWPEWFTKEHFAPFQRQARTWSALFQQRPAPETGIYFEADWLRPYSRPQDPPLGVAMPDRRALTIYGASDHAVTSEGGDYTVHVVVGIDLHGRMFLLDLWRQQASPDKWIEAFCNLVEQWRPVGWAEETGQIRSGIGPFLVKRLRERRLYVVRAQFPTRGDKAVRAQSIRGRMEMDGLYVPTHAPWYPELRRELLAFPAGKYDDQVDALGLIGQVLDKMVSGRPLPRPAEAPKLLSTDPKLCTVTLDDLFTANEQRGKHRVERIH